MNTDQISVGDQLVLHPAGVGMLRDVTVIQVHDDGSFDVERDDAYVFFNVPADRLSLPVSADA